MHFSKGLIGLAEKTIEQIEQRQYTKRSVKQGANEITGSQEVSDGVRTHRLITFAFSHRF